jgi:cytochrome c oxidase assembly protein subunit 11
VEVPPVQSATARRAANRRLALQLAGVAVLFAGFGFALVPLYDVFCRITGLDGRTGVVAANAAANTQVDASRWVTVEFLSHAMPGTGLSFEPERFSMRVHPGAVAQVNYVVRNPSDRTFVGQAVPNVTPGAAARHFRKIECFCFTQQTFRPGETRTLPVTFVVSPELAGDLGTLTLSYTFFEAVQGRG